MKKSTKIIIGALVGVLLVIWIVIMALNFADLSKVKVEPSDTPQDDFQQNSEIDFEQNPEVDFSKFVHEWRCEESTVEDKNEYTGYLHLRVEPNGYFSMYDIGAGNPGIAGYIEVLSNDKLTLHVIEDADTDIPTAWTGMSFDETMDYSLANDTLKMIYKHGKKTATMVFHIDE